MTTGILLINLGTPKTPTTGDVRRYLRQFLFDPLVIDVNPVARWILVNLIIAPFRSGKSAKAYRSIWTEYGSPLLVFTRRQTEALQNKMGPDYPVAFGMRYGAPSIEDGLDELIRRKAKRLVVCPLYPQYAESSFESSVRELKRILKEKSLSLPYEIVPPFYADPGFIAAFAAQGRSLLQEKQPDHVLFSFHGLPERHVTKLDETGGHCLKKDDCCEKIEVANRNCYRAQCFRTAQGIISSLNLGLDRTSIAFQSRLGRTPWIKPYTDVVLHDLAKKGVKKVAVFCPAFVADCLETLEEVQIRYRKLFIGAGGEDLFLVPSLNSSPAWIEALAGLVKSSMREQNPRVR